MNHALMTRPEVDRPVRARQSDDIRHYRNIPVAVGTTAFILPCHNEAADLPAALESIKNQVDARVDTILVVSDNSTDDTIAIAQNAGVSVIETVGNHYKKAGALNTGVRHLLETNGALPEFIITGDGDTEYDKHYVSRSLRVMHSRPKLGVLSAVCLGKTGLVKLKKWPRLRSLLNYVLVWAQRAEYARATVLRLRHNIHTMSGAGSMIRAEAAIDAIYKNAAPICRLNRRTIELYKEHSANLVEDFALTLDIKEAGWSCTNNAFVIAHTDLMRDFKSLLRQRIRWVRGTIDELRRRKFRKGSRASVLSIIFGLAMIPVFYGINAFALTLIISGALNLTDLWLFPFMGAYQALTVRKMGWKSMLVSFTLLPEMLFAVMRHTWIFISIGKSFLSTKQNWE